MARLVEVVWQKDVRQGMIGDPKRQYAAVEMGQGPSPGGLDILVERGRFGWMMSGSHGLVWRGCCCGL